jgi:diketogulonate reductase-like aldo/keto reductase
MPDLAPPSTLSLPDGSPMPRFGLGTWRIGEGRRTRAGDLAALRLALELGYRLFDTAEMYGEGGAESLLGEALAAAQRGPLHRDALFVVSKVYPHHASAAGVVAACERSLKRLRLDHLDLYLLHWRGAEPLAETVRGFEQLRRRGLIHHWGVSNFDLADMQELMAVPGGTACASNQVWYSLSRRGVEFDLLPWQQLRQMPLMAYSPIDQGALAEHAGLAALAARHGLTPGQLALAWTLAQPGVVSIPKSSDPQRLRQNLEAARRPLPAEALDALQRLFPPPRRRQALAIG